MAEALKHYDESKIISAPPGEVFEFVDDPLNLSKHMEKPRWQMLWGWMRNTPDEKGGKEVGSVIRMNGSVLGIKLGLEEVIKERTVGVSKSWKTNWVKLVVMGNYELGYHLTPANDQTKLNVFINYDLPESNRTRWLGVLFGDMYARWCVRQMLKDTQKHFQSTKNTL